MKLKYYMRGIGIGVIFATLLLTISFYFGSTGISSKEMTDEEIIEKATELGMVMPEEDSEESEEEATEETEATDSEAPSTEEVTEETEEETEVENEPVVESSETTVKYIPFTVNSGESSDTVAANLYNAGLVDSASEFNDYMNTLGVDNRIQSGTFYVRADSTYDDIIVLLVNKDHRTTTPPTE
jgi:cytoskeletal protein RodZ